MKQPICGSTRSPLAVKLEHEPAQAVAAGCCGPKLMGTCGRRRRACRCRPLAYEVSVLTQASTLLAPWRAWLQTPRLNRSQATMKTLMGARADQRRRRHGHDLKRARGPHFDTFGPDGNGEAGGVADCERRRYGCRGCPRANRDAAQAAARRSIPSADHEAVANTSGMAWEFGGFAIEVRHGLGSAPYRRGVLKPGFKRRLHGSPSLCSGSPAFSSLGMAVSSPPTD